MQQHDTFGGSVSRGEELDLTLGGPRLGLGLAALGRPGYITLGHAGDFARGRSVEAIRAQTHEVLDAAYEAGIRYFDAARSYGRAEEFLSTWLQGRQLAPDAVATGSKWGYIYVAGWRVDVEVHERKELTAANFVHQQELTRELLGPWLRLYQIHSATLESGVLEDRAVLDAMAELRAETGVALGLSVSGPQQGETVLRAIETGIFGSVQATWNVLEPSAGDALAQAHAAGLKVIVKEPVSNGRLTERGSGPGLELLQAEGVRAGAGPDAVALAVALAQPWADVVLSGATTVAMLRSNLAALELAPSPSLLERLPSVASAPDQYWQLRSELPWT
jgi:aryl-alcohol dehydrogenase-like predicted oxidoreductase